MTVPTNSAAPARASERRLVVLLPYVLVAFAANSLITRHVVAAHEMDPGILSAARFMAGAVALAVIALVQRERIVVGRSTLLPALWLAVYAVCISYGYRYIGAAAGTFVFYTAVLLTLAAHDVATGGRVPVRRALGIAVALAGIAVLTLGSDHRVTTLGIALLAATGIAWGLYTAAGRVGAGGDPRVATTGNFVLVAAVVTLPAAVGATAGLRVTVSGLAWSVAMGAGTTALAYVAWYVCQRSMSGTAAGSAQLVVPILTATGAVLLLGEQVSATLLVAAVLVGAGLWLGRPSRARVGHSAA